MPGNERAEREKWSIAEKKDEGPSLIFFWADAAASSRSLPLFVFVYYLNSI